MSDARRRILERRARFVAAAISGVSLGCDRPLACLDVEPVKHEMKDATAAPPASASASSPMPCLVPPKAEDAKPIPCLGPPRPKVDGGAAPMPCLRVAPKVDPPD